MRTFKSLQPEGLPLTFDVAIYGEEPLVSVEESEGRIVVQYIFPGFYLSDDEQDVEGEKIGFEQLNIAHTGFLGESGKPLLPSFGRYVQIPFNCDYTITVEKGEPVPFDDILVSPAQEKLTDSPEEEHIFEYDREFYTCDQLYPEDIVEVSGPFEIDGYNTLLLHVRPLQYNAAKKKVFGWSTITLTIDVTPREPSEHILAHPDMDRAAYGNLFLNPERGIEERLNIDTRGVMAASSNVPTGPEFLIIYHNTFKNAAETLAKWKNVRGLRTVVVPITKTGNTVNGIKEYIRKVRGTRLSRLRYVLLFGDVEMITPETIPGLGTDYYYSTKTGPLSGRYVFPWLSIGRIPVKTAKEAMAVVKQIIAYERNPPRDSKYYERMAFAAYFEDDGDGKSDRGYMQTMEYIRDRLKSRYSIKRIYVTNNPHMKEYSDGTPIPQEVINAVLNGSTATKTLISATSEGHLTIGHRDHGSPSGWVCPSFNLTHLDRITGEVPSMFYSVNCSTGMFDSTAPSECFAEKLLRIKRGAPSLIAATRVSGTWANNHLMKALFDAMWGGVLSTFPGSTASYPVKYNRLGDVLNYAKSYLPIAMSGDHGSIKYHFEIYHIIGDPTLELWRSKPVPVRMNVAVERWHMMITLSSCPQGSVITIWNKDKLLKRIEPSSTYMRIPLKDISMGAGTSTKVEVCFWAPGCTFRKADVIVTEP